MDNLPRDYGWNTYAEKYTSICKQNNLSETNYYYLAKKEDEIVGVADLLVSK
jgi:CRISPR/Cas system CMR-associated protein Cmr5 small subunit